jgi:hypothetical protein
VTTVGWSTLDVIPSVKNLRSQLEQQTSRDFVAAGRRGGEQFGDAAGKAAGGRFKSKFGSVAKDAFAPIAGIVAGAAVVDLFKDAISGASDLAESGNKIQVIFGDASKQVNAFAAQGAKALGQTRLEVLNAAGSFGTFGKAAGLSGGALADFSTKLVGLSTDMASFFNTSPEQAIEAIGAALRGEAEPIRAYGVLLDDATLRQEALRQGLISTTKQALTPQQKVLAAYQVILQQTSDAQGDFGRTSGGLANQQRILAAQWSEMKTELGSKLLPAATEIVHVFNDGVIPAIGNTGGVVADSVRFFNGLPTPVKAATAALVAFRAAQALGAGDAISRGASGTSRALDELRLRAMLVADEYKRLRQGQLEIIQNSGKFTPAAGRMASALGAIQTGAAGAGRGLKAGLSGALSLVGGPWGAAFIAGTAIVAHFWQEHQRAKQRVEDFTATLDKETGAITESSKEFAAKQLLDAGVLAGAERLGLSLKTVTDAALGNKTALAAVNTQVAAMGSLNDGAAQDAINLKSALDDSNGTVQRGLSDWRLMAGAMGVTATATDKVVTATSDYTDELKSARDAVKSLLDEENKRRNANLGILGDQIALNQALADANKEAKDGKATLDLTTQAGRDNAGALRDLASAWNDSAPKVKNAKGAYADMRDQFIQVAEKMGASETKAKNLADRLLDLPKNVPVKFATPGLKDALNDLKTLRDFATERIVITAQATKNRADRANAFATGGMIGGRGTGTSDSNLIWASRGEFMQRKAAVDYYGVDFMRRLNALQVPKYANGGLIGSATIAAPMGQHISGTLGIDRDGVAYIYGVARSEVDAAQRADLGRRRRSSLDGVPPL